MNNMYFLALPSMFFSPQRRKDSRRFCRVKGCKAIVFFVNLCAFLRLCGESFFGEAKKYKILFSLKK